MRVGISSIPATDYQVNKTTFALSSKCSATLGSSTQVVDFFCFGADRYVAVTNSTIMVRLTPLLEQTDSLRSMPSSPRRSAPRLSQGRGLLLR